MKFQVFGSLDASFQEASAKGTGGEMDEIKRMLLETNPILLVTTFIVTILHTVFEFLAFSNDVSHWRKKKELVGVSVRTILTKCVAASDAAVADAWTVFLCSSLSCCTCWTSKPTFFVCLRSPHHSNEK
jgi:hypothetical protein